jgi:hypothetical protein
MRRSIDSFRFEAQKKFLGKGAVVGVGLGDAENHEIVFLLAEDVPSTRLKISRWAKQAGINAKILVTGKLQISVR